MAVHITAPGSVVIVEVPAAWTEREAQREQSRVLRNISKVAAPTHVIVVRGSGSAGDAADDDDADALEELEASVAAS
jgi:hypothetical protein